MLFVVLVLVVLLLVVPAYYTRACNARARATGGMSSPPPATTGHSVGALTRGAMELERVSDSAHDANAKNMKAARVMHVDADENTRLAAEISAQATDPFAGAFAELEDAVDQLQRWRDHGLPALMGFVSAALERAKAQEQDMTLAALSYDAQCEQEEVAKWKALRRAAQEEHDALAAMPLPRSGGVAGRAKHQRERDTRLQGHLAAVADCEAQTAVADAKLAAARDVEERQRRFPAGSTGARALKAQDELLRHTEAARGCVETVVGDARSLFSEMEDARDRLHGSKKAYDLVNSPVLKLLLTFEVEEALLVCREESLWRRALEYDPNHVKCLCGYAYLINVHHNDEKTFAEAKSLIARALEIDHTLPWLVENKKFFGFPDDYESPAERAWRLEREREAAEAAEAARLKRIAAEEYAERERKRQERIRAQKEREEKARRERLEAERQRQVADLLDATNEHVMARRWGHAHAAAHKAKLLDPDNEDLDELLLYIEQERPPSVTEAAHWQQIQQDGRTFWRHEISGEVRTTAPKGWVPISTEEDALKAAERKVVAADAGQKPLEMGQCHICRHVNESSQVRCKMCGRELLAELVHVVAIGECARCGHVSAPGRSDCLMCGEGLRQFSEAEVAAERLNRSKQFKQDVDSAEVQLAREAEEQLRELEELQAREPMLN